MKKSTFYKHQIKIYKSLNNNFVFEVFSDNKMGGELITLELSADDIKTLLNYE